MSTKNDQNLIANLELDETMAKWQKEIGDKIHLVWLKEDPTDEYCLTYATKKDGILLSRHTIRGTLDDIYKKLINF